MAQEMVVPISAVLQMISDICSPCQEKVRQQIAATQILAASNFLRPGLQQILENMAQEKHVTVDAIQAKNNEPKLVNIRREIASRARNAGYSLPQIARALNRHHSSVMNLLHPRKLRGV